MNLSKHSSALVGTTASLSQVAGFVVVVIETLVISRVVSPQGTIISFIGVGGGGGEDGARSAMYPPPSKKKNSEKYFSGNYHVNFGNFVNFASKCHVKLGYFVNFSHTAYFWQKYLPPKVD